MNIITQTNLLNEKEILYTDPLTNKQITITTENFAQGVNEVRINTLINLCIELADRFDRYYTDLLKFADIAGKAKHSINEARMRLKLNISIINQFATIETLAAHVYENIIPYLATCTIKSNKYFELLHIIEDQALEFSSNHQFSDTNPIFVKS